MKAALALLFLALPASADPWIDYNLLLQQNADRVVGSTDAAGQVTRQLDLGDGVTVTCTDQCCVGMDQNGAMGCARAIYSELLAVAEVRVMPPGRTRGMTDVHRLQTAFIARNAVPPRNVAEVAAVHQGVVDRYRAEVEMNPWPARNCWPQSRTSP